LFVVPFNFDELKTASIAKRACASFSPWLARRVHPAMSPYCRPSQMAARGTA
jgi:hypothetical protein